jgi:transposase/predicted nucleic acid-binding Zn finger protein
MDTREDRGRAIAKGAALERKGDGPYWLVHSQSREAKYLVDEENRTCTCPDYEAHRQPCKHVFAVQYTIQRETNERGETTVTETVRVTYAQDWPAYNAAQTHEKEHVATLLADLCSAIDNGVQKRGRPRLLLSDGVFSAVMKVYGTTSGRRAMTDMREYEAKGLISKALCYNSVFNVLENKAVTPILRRMIEESAAPLKAVETDFAVDSSGFSTSTYARWFSAKYGREMAENKWLKAHVMVGVKTNVIASVEITDAYTHDTTQFPALVDRAASTFNIARVSADKAYSSRANHLAVESVGAEPYIAFKTNALAYGSDADVWSRMYAFFVLNREEFLRHYHQRSNVETTFSMVKAKFGTKVRSKTETAQVNEILCKLLCHNLCCLVHATYELGIETTFWNKVAA